jgi:hypothetical protein
VSRLQQTLRATETQLGELSPQHEPALPNALLILAIQRMVARDGARVTANVLVRLADAVRAGPAPPPERAIDLSSYNA